MRFRKRVSVSIRCIIAATLLLSGPVLSFAQDDNQLKPPVTKIVGKAGYKLPVLFGKVKVPGAGPVKPNGQRGDANISVRTYGVADMPENAANARPLIPGATFVFKPGDTLRLKLENFLNRSTNPALNVFQDNPQQGTPGKADDITGHASHEISIPNNGDMTNLHVHGLHVDPKQDNVTLIILPEDGDPSTLVPEIQRLVPTINRWWTRPYKYKIPEDHVPGTFWYHAHKHGATATQVENGMAGTLLMLPRNDEDSIVPGLWNNDPEKSHDRVLVLQGLLNVGGTSQGRGQGLFAGQSLGGPVSTINGQHEPTLQLPPGQLERWRFVFAGANHKGAGSIWVGKIVPTLATQLVSTLKSITDQASAAPYIKSKNNQKPTQLPTTGTSIACSSIPGKVKLIAVDGVPMWNAVDITPQTPSFGAPGNRNDFLIQADASAGKSGPYNVYLNYPLTMEDILATYPKLFAGSAGKWRQLVLSQQLGNVQYTTADDIPNNMTLDPYGLSLGEGSGKTKNQPTYDNFTPYWTYVDGDNNPLPANQAPNKKNPEQIPVTPLLHGSANDRTNGVDVGIRAQNFPADAGWQPANAGAGKPMSAGILMKLNISGKATGPKMPTDDALNRRLSQVSPASHHPKDTILKKLNRQGQLVPGIPSYVAPITAPEDGQKFDGRQVVVFDRGQFTFSYLNKSTGLDLEFRQFWLNGRQFSPDDSVGNPAAQQLIQAPLLDIEPRLGSYSPNAAETFWTHRVGKEKDRNSHLLVANPGYYLPVEPVKLNGQTGYRYRTADADNPGPTYKQITGLAEPRLPVSTTAEEWLLVNNSDMFHPFHIHISPFFVEDIGQLAYDGNKAAGSQWSLNTLKDSNSPFKWVAGNWWDVIVIPPHGYVKFKTWMNMPIQLPENTADSNSPLVSVENANVYGSWVLHCHILRHEDRGMMTMVNTRPKLQSLSGEWQTSSGRTVTIADDQGQLVVTGIPGKTVGGTFNEGLGNPFKTQPWAGALQFKTPQATTTYTFNVTDDVKEIVLSDGKRWTRKAATEFKPKAISKVDLTGFWIDGDGNIASIEQGAQGAAGYPLTFQPVDGPAPVWWGKGKGTWGTALGATTATYAGNQTLVNNSGRNQKLTMTVTGDGNSIVFGNGIRWTRTNKP